MTVYKTKINFRSIDKKFLLLSENYVDYLPASDACAASITKRGPSNDFISTPFRNHDIFGVGLPDATQSNDSVVFSFTCTKRSLEAIDGTTAIVTTFKSK